MNWDTMSPGDATQLRLCAARLSDLAMDVALSRRKHSERDANVISREAEILRQRADDEDAAQPPRAGMIGAIGALPSTIPAEAAGIDASTDTQAIAAWLAQYAGSLRTLDNCRKEAERFYLWIGKQGKALAEVRHEDVMRFRAFLGNPSAEWVSATPHPRTSPDWRPLRGPLSAASIRQAEIVLAGMFGWLVRARYLPINPFALSRRLRGTRRLQSRFLTRRQLQIVLDTVDADRADGDARRAARDRWLIRLLYQTGLRVSEAVGHDMGAFERREGAAGHRWGLSVTGKGGKPRTIPATTALLDALRAFRSAWGLSALPTPGDATPLLPSLRGGGHLTRTGAYRAIEAIFAAAAARCDDETDAARLREASTHWMRHTRGTHLVADEASLKTVQELLGHASLTTTSLYVHDELDRVQDDIERAEQRAERAAKA